MESMILSENEIRCIQSFVQEVSNIPMVECVYLVSYLDNNIKQKHVDVITIYNESLYYNGKLTGEEIMRDTKFEMANLESIIYNFSEQLKNGQDKRMKF